MSALFEQDLIGLAYVALGVAVAAGCRSERAAEQAAEEAMQEAAAVAFAVERTVSGLHIPESVQLGPDGRYYVSEIGEFGADGDGRILAFDPGTWESTVFADGLDDPKGLAFRDDVLYVTDRVRIVGLTPQGPQVEVGADAFPETPVFLNDLVAGPDGSLYASDTGEFDATDGAVYRIDATGAVEPVITADDSPEIASPNGLAFDPEGNLLVVDFHTGKLLRIDGANAVVIAEGFGGGDGLEFAPGGTLYVTDVRGGRVFRVSFGADGAEVEEVAQVASAADLGLDGERGRLVIPQLGENSLTVISLP